MARVKVTDPYSGATIIVDADSPQAKAWGESSPRAKESEPKKESAKGVSRRSARKSD